MAKIHAAMVSVMDVINDTATGHGHNEQVAKIVEDHYADGYTLVSAFYCNASGHWPAHIMLIFVHS